MQDPDGSGGEAQVGQDVDRVDDVHVHVDGIDGVGWTEVAEMLVKC